MTLIEGFQDAALETADDGATTVDRKAKMPTAVRSFYQPVERELLEVEEILQSELVSRDPDVNALLRHGIRLGGKRMRPALLLLAAKACGAVGPDHLLLAAVLEMIHLATLVHDDVLDEATVRRHSETMNARAGNQVSVLVGDFLFSHSFYLASTLDSTYACRRIGRSTNIVCEGEMRQIQNRGNYNISEQQYLEIIAAKTAELCACCCELGAYYAGADEATIEALRSYGRDLGIAFQIVDDLLDVVGDQGQTGKSLGTDLEQEKATLPLIHALAAADSHHREQLCNALASRDADCRRDVRQRLKQSGSLAYTRQRAKQFAASARSHLAKFADNDAVRSLAALTEFVVVREH